jgi:hypothetical protein
MYYIKVAIKIYKPKKIRFYHKLIRLAPSYPGKGFGRKMLNDLIAEDIASEKK